MNKQEAIEKIKYTDTLNINDHIAHQQIDMVIKNQVLDIVSQIDEPQKPKVSRVAVKFYEKYKGEILSLDEWFSDFYSKEAIEDFPRMEELTEWLHGNDNETNRRRELALATLVTLGIDAVEIKQEKLYTVEIDGVSSSRLFKNIRTNEYLFHSGNGSEWYTDRLTETEIKQKDERLWQWAKEVEEK